MDFAKKNVVVTGGATGIGFALAKLLGSRGANILIAARRNDRMEEATKTLVDQGITASNFECDVTNRKEWEALADHAWKHFGQVDVLINNAGIACGLANVFEADIEQAQEVLNTNFFGTWHGVQVFGQRLIEQGTPCAIYNMGSENSLFNGVPTNGAYVSSKHAIFALTDGLREDAPEFMTVGLICPGLVISELNDATKIIGMPTDEYAAIAVPQMEAGEYLIVSHPYKP